MTSNNRLSRLTAPRKLVPIGALGLALSSGLFLRAQAPPAPASTVTGQAASAPATSAAPLTVPPAALAPLAPPESLAAFLQTLPANDRQELVGRQQRFEQLSDVEKERMRTLHAALRNHPDAARLDSVLLQYSQWLSTLTPNERYAILDTPADQRVDRIRQLRAREEDQRLTELGLNTQDARVILDWFNQQLSEHQGKLLEGMDARERERLERIPNDNARKIALSAQMLFNRGRNNRADQLFNMIRREERDRLKALLSNNAREKLLAEEARGSDTDANKLLAEWIRASAMNRFRPPEITDEELLKSLENLPAAVRADLERLPRDQMYRALRERFHGFRGDMFDRRRGGHGENFRGGDNRGRPGDRERGEGRPPRDGRPPFDGPGFDRPFDDAAGPPPTPPPSPPSEQPPSDGAPSDGAPSDGAPSDGAPSDGPPSDNGPPAP